MTKREVARTEVVGDPHVLDYGGQEYILPPAIPLLALEAMEENRVIAFLHSLVGDDQWKMFAESLNVEDLPALADAIGELYGQDLGESEASGGS